MPDVELSPASPEPATPTRSSSLWSDDRAPAPPREPLQPLAGQAPLRNIKMPKELPEANERELSPDEAQAALDQLNREHVETCTRCGLCQGRTRTVFGAGNPRPELVFVGEGPGAEEDRQGVPFVGRAGQLLTRMLAAMTLTREQVYISNIVKCRPPGNRTPTDEEMATCAPYLFRQLAVLRPKVIVTLGRPSSQALLLTRTPIGRLRGSFHEFPPPELASFGLPSVKLMPTFHPAYLLRSPGEKGKTWEDLQQVMRFMGIAVPGGSRS